MEADCGEQVESKSQDIVWGQLVSLLLTNMRNTENMPIPVPEFIVHQLFLVAFQMPFSPSAHRFLCCFICVGFFLCVCFEKKEGPGTNRLCWMCRLAWDQRLRGGTANRSGAKVLLRSRYWLRLWKQAIAPTAVISVFLVAPVPGGVSRKGRRGLGGSLGGLEEAAGAFF